MPNWSWRTIDHNKDTCPCGWGASMQWVNVFYSLCPRLIWRRLLFNKILTFQLLLFIIITSIYNRSGDETTPKFEKPLKFCAIPLCSSVSTTSNTEMAWYKMLEWDNNRAVTKKMLHTLHWRAVLHCISLLFRRWDVAHKTFPTCAKQCYLKINSTTPQY